MIIGIRIALQIVTAILAVMSPLLPQFIARQNGREYAYRLGLIGINATLCWRYRHDVEDYIGMIKGKLIRQLELSLIIALIIIGFLYYVIVRLLDRVFKPDNLPLLPVFACVSLVTLIATVVCLMKLDHKRRGYHIPGVDGKLKLGPTESLYSRDFLRSNARLLGISVAFPIFLLVYVIGIPGITQDPLMIFIAILAVMLVVLHIAYLRIALKVVADQLCLRSLLLFTNLVSKDGEVSTHQEVESKEGIDGTEMQHGVSGLDSSCKSVYNARERHYDGSKVIYDIISLDAGLPFLKVITVEVHPTGSLISSDVTTGTRSWTRSWSWTWSRTWSRTRTRIKIRTQTNIKINISTETTTKSNISTETTTKSNIATISIQLLRFDCAKQTDNGLSYAHLIHPDELQIVWIPDELDTKFRELVGLTPR